VWLPVGEPLKAALDAAKKEERKAVTILTNTRGRPWTEDGFRTSWGKAFAKGFGDLHSTTCVEQPSRGLRSPAARCPRSHRLPDTRSKPCRRSLTRTISAAGWSLRNRRSRNSTRCTDDEQISQNGLQKVLSVLSLYGAKCLKTLVGAPGLEPGTR
jgi:hypothetical protein